MQHQELPQLNDELTLLEKWQAANSVEEKLHVLEGADANFLNGNLEPAQEKGLFPPLIRILHLQQKARFTEPLLHQIKALLAVKDYILTGKDSWRKLTLLRWALEYKQFAVAKEILSAAQAKNVLTEVLQGASHNNQPPVEGLLLSIIHSFFGVSEEQPIEKQSSFLQMLSEMEELLSFLESLPSENKLLTQNEGEINCLHSFIKAYREKYYAQSVTERVTLDPQTEINFLLDLYKKVVTGLSGANNFLTSLNELVELSRDPNNLGRFSQISQYSEAVEKISSDNLKKAPLLRKSILEILNSLMKKALQKDLSQNKTPFFVLLEEIRSSFTKVCSMPVEDEIITPFIQNIKNTINIQAEKKDEPAEADHSPLKLLLSEEDITLLQNTMQAILQEPANFTAANLSEKIKNLSNDGIKQPVLDHLLTPLHKEALLWDCEEKSKKVNALLKNSPLAESTKQYIRSQVEEIHIKRRDNRLSPEEAEKFRVNMENLSLPSELKKSLATFALSIVACAILLSASALAAPAAAAVAVTSGGYSLFKGVQHQRGQEQIKTELQKPHNVPDNQAPLSPSDKPK